ncbi:hypothetical protein D3C76_1774810 [compost metagenome]
MTMVAKSFNGLGLNLGSRHHPENHWVLPLKVGRATNLDDVGTHYSLPAARRNAETYVWDFRQTRHQLVVADQPNIYGLFE